MAAKTKPGARVTGPHFLRFQMTCAICEHKLDTEREIIRIEFGAVEIGIKSGALCFFREPTIANLDVHFDCLLDKLEYGLSKSDMLHCSMCGATLEGEPTCRMTLGTMNFDGFVPFESDENLSLICESCLYEGIGPFIEDVD